MVGGNFRSVPSCRDPNRRRLQDKTKHIVGDDWERQSYLQLLLALGAEVDLTVMLDPDIENSSASSVRSVGGDASGCTSVVDPDQLSTIEEEAEDDVAPDVDFVVAPAWFTAEASQNITNEEKQLFKLCGYFQDAG